MEKLRTSIHKHPFYVCKLSPAFLRWSLSNVLRIPSLAAGKRLLWLLLYSSMQFYFKVIKLLVLLFLACEFDWPFLRWAWSCLNGHPAPANIKSTAEETVRGAESGSSDNLHPSPLAARSRNQVVLLQTLSPVMGCTREHLASQALQESGCTGLSRESLGVFCAHLTHIVSVGEQGVVCSSTAPRSQADNTN